MYPDHVSDFPNVLPSVPYTKYMDLMIYNFYSSKSMNYPCMCSPDLLCYQYLDHVNDSCSVYEYINFIIPNKHTNI